MFKAERIQRGPPAGKDEQMKRNMLKIAGENWKGFPDRYSPTVSEERIALKLAMEKSVYDAFDLMFRYGFQLGRRYEKKHGKRSGSGRDK